MDSVIVIVVLGAALAGFVQGLSGSNFGLVAMAVWAWTLNPTLTGPMVVGGLIGVPMGVLLLHHTDPTLFRLMVGILLAAWCPLMLLSSGLPRIYGDGRGVNAGVGLLGGIMGGLGGLTGPVPALWAVLKGWDRHTQRSIIQGFNLAMQVLTMITYLVSGTVTWEALGLFPVVAVSVLVPTLIGIRLYRRFSDQAFRKVVLGMLALSGVTLIVQSLPKLI